MLSGSCCFYGSLLVWPTAQTRESNPGCWHCGDGSGDSLCRWLGLYLICLSLPAICAVCPSLSPPLSVAVYLSISYQQTIRKTTPRRSDVQAGEVPQCHLNHTFEISICGQSYRSFRFRGIFVLFDMCHLFKQQWKWMCVYKSSPSLCLYPSQGRERLWQWGIKSRYPRYPHQSACYYFIRLISGCLTPPSFSLVRPSAAEFLISAKTMACLSCSTK